MTGFPFNLTPTSLCRLQGRDWFDSSDTSTFVYALGNDIGACPYMCPYGTVAEVTPAFSNAPVTQANVILSYVEGRITGFHPWNQVDFVLLPLVFHHILSFSASTSGTWSSSSMVHRFWLIHLPT